jgi:uncharacterized membrane protein YgcG
MISTPLVILLAGASAAIVVALMMWKRRRRVGADPASDVSRLSRDVTFASWLLSLAASIGLARSQAGHLEANSDDGHTWHGSHLDHGGGFADGGGFGGGDAGGL